MAKIEYTRKIENIAGAVSIDEYERSLTKISRALEEQDNRRKGTPQKGMRRSVKEEFEGVNMLNSILAPYELVRK
ncbi:hypothetical protein D3Z36_06775 [Lachnospiraceae bacterium]|nr:hypothetical protein [Lachnospiraceae bacterium]